MLRTSTPSFLGMPAEIRQIIYRIGFSDVDEPEIYLDEANDTVLPCQPRDYYTYSRRRATRYGLSFSQLTHNPVIALLLTCRSIYEESLPWLYDPQLFIYRSPCKSLAKLPQVFVDNMKALCLSDDDLVRALIGPLERVGRLPSVLSDTWMVYSAIENYTTYDSTITKTWCTVIVERLNLQFLTVNSLSDVQMLLLIRHLASNGAWRRRSTQIHLTTYCHKAPNKQRSTRTKALMEMIPKFKTQPSGLSDRATISAVDALLLRCPLGDLEPEMLMGLSWGGIKLHPIGEYPNDYGKDRVKRKYRIRFPYKYELSKDRRVTRRISLSQGESMKHVKDSVSLAGTRDTSLGRTWSKELPF